VVPNQRVYTPFHCNLIRTYCNAIQTLLQLNSSNYTGEAEARALTECRIAVLWRIVGYVIMQEHVHLLMIEVRCRLL